MTISNYMTGTRSCLMYAGFKRVAPEHEVQMDLNDPFLTALPMHKNGGGKH